MPTPHTSTLRCLRDVLGSPRVPKNLIGEQDSSQILDCMVFLYDRRHAWIFLFGNGDHGKYGKFGKLGILFLT